MRGFVAGFFYFYFFFFFTFYSFLILSFFNSSNLSFRLLYQQLQKLFLQNTAITANHEKIPSQKIERKSPLKNNNGKRTKQHKYKFILPNLNFFFIFNLILNLYFFISFSYFILANIN